jgi:hypothetical protein
MTIQVFNEKFVKDKWRIIEVESDLVILQAYKPSVKTWVSVLKYPVIKNEIDQTIVPPVFITHILKNRNY